MSEVSERRSRVGIAEAVRDVLLVSADPREGDDDDTDDSHLLIVF